MKPKVATHQARNLEDILLEELQSGSASILNLIEAIHLQRPGTSKQGVYTALRKLHLQEKVTLYGGKAALNTVWIEKMLSFFSVAQYHATARESHDNSFLSLTDGEKIQYSFKDPVQTDIFWSHAFLLLAKIVPTYEPYYIYNPHNWFLLSRTSNEARLINTVTQDGRSYHLVAGHGTILDALVAKHFDGKKATYHLATKPLFEKSNYYLNVIGDYIIEVSIDPKIATALDAFYDKTKIWTDETQHELNDIIKTRGRSKFTIRRNQKKADRLKVKIIAAMV